MRRRGQEGSALLTAVLTLFLVSVALALLAASLQLRMRLVQGEVETIQLVALADAALAEALAGVHADPLFPGAQEHPLGRGTVTSQVTHLGFGRYDVVATGTYAGRKRSVFAEVVRWAGSTDALDGDGVIVTGPEVRVEVRRWRRLPG